MIERFIRRHILEPLIAAIANLTETVRQYSIANDRLTHEHGELLADHVEREMRALQAGLEQRIAASESAIMARCMSAELTLEGRMRDLLELTDKSYMNTISALSALKSITTHIEAPPQVSLMQVQAAHDLASIRAELTNLKSASALWATDVPKLSFGTIQVLLAVDYAADKYDRDVAHAVGDIRVNDVLFWAKAVIREKGWPGVDDSVLKTVLDLRDTAIDLRGERTQPRIGA